MPAEAFIPKTGVDKRRRRLYDRAHAHARERLPGLPFTEWLRRVLDDAARKELALEGCPCCQASIHAKVSRRTRPVVPDS